MQSPNDVLARLRRVKSLRFDARSELNTGWDGVGTGTVTVFEPVDGVVVFDEAGTWRPTASKAAPIGFKNVFRWSTVESVLRLEHLRFGPNRPVLLFDMVPAENETWREAGAHHCHEDCYTASLGIEDGAVVVAWSVVGPQKQESIRYTYW